MKIKKIIITMLCCIMTLGGTACGCSKNGTKDFVANKYNISIAAQEEDGEQAILQKLKEEYEKIHPDVNIVIRDFAGKTYSEIMQTWSQDKTQLPMISWMDDRDFAAYAKGGYYVDLRPYYEKDSSTNYNNYYQTMLDSAAYNGEYRPTTSYTGSVEGKTASNDAEYGLYFAPRDYNEIVIVYNKTKFSEYHIDIPTEWNWTTFIELLHTAGQNILQYNTDRGALNERVIYLHNSYEPVYTSVFEELGSDGIIKNGEINIGSDKNKEIYTYLYDNIFNWTSTYTGGNGERTSKNISADTNAESNFYSGLTLMTVCPRPTLYSIWNKLKATGYDVDVLSFPTKKIAAGCSGYGITKQWASDTQTVGGITRTNEELCWEFIKYVITTEGQEVAGTTGVSVPILKSLKDTGTWRKALSAELNHDAFVTPEELSMRTFNVFPAERLIRSNLRADITAFLIELEGKKGASDSRDALIEEYISYFDQHLKAAK